MPRLAAAFPQTFFPDPKQVQPLKAFLYRDLLKRLRAGALPAGIDHTQLKAFLHWYGGRTSYLKALARGAGRLNLPGAVVATDIPEALRQRACEAVQRRQAHRAAQAAKTATISPAPTPTPTPVPLPYSLEDLYAMAIDAKLEVTLKFSTLPNAKPAGQGKRVFALKTQDGQYVTAEVGNKVWNKLTQAAAEWPSWVVALTGTLGPRADQGFRLENPGLQVFEKKAKAADSPAPAASAPTPVALPPPAAPVTVTPGAGPATVTVTKRAPLGLKRDAPSGGGRSSEAAGP